MDFNVEYVVSERKYGDPRYRHTTQLHRGENSIKRDYEIIHLFVPAC